MSEFVSIAASVKLGKDVRLGKFINLYGCEIGDETKIGAFVEIQKNASVGKRCKISSHTFVCEGVEIQDNVFIGHGVTFVNDMYPRATTASGDLQTEGQWADFVLQLQCVSNGDHCNSGVFFRCRPGEYQQGYEAQIRNEFKDEPTQEYTIEEYDPKTHELKGSKKEKYTAVDYGTGAIYRRQPARKELSKDREWFGMTIVASGRHLAVWVNGVQASDWTDDRPTADNARKGCQLEKGPISLQGHDATTDLNFRNIRIVDLAGMEEKKP